MAELKTLKAFLSCDKLISVNKRLWGSSSRGMRHSDEYERECNQLRASLRDSGVEEGSMGNDHLYSVTYVLYLKDNISRRDTDNLVKCITDVLSKYLGFNDNKLISYRFSKRMLVEYPEGEPFKEYVYVKLEQVDGWFDRLKIKFVEFRNFMEKILRNEAEE